MGSGHTEPILFPGNLPPLHDVRAEHVRNFLCVLNQVLRFFCRRRAVRFEARARLAERRGERCFVACGSGVNVGWQLQKGVETFKGDAGGAD
jgi:hypothetical protein